MILHSRICSDLIEKKKKNITLILFALIVTLMLLLFTFTYKHFKFISRRSDFTKLLL